MGLLLKYDETIDQYSTRLNLPKSLTLNCKGQKFEFILVPAGEFWMGCAVPQPPRPYGTNSLIEAAIAGFTLVVVASSILRKRRFRFSLGKLIVLTVGSAFLLHGIIGWESYNQELSQYHVDLGFRPSNELPLTKVRISKPYYLLRDTVNEIQYSSVMGLKDDNKNAQSTNPAQPITWEQADDFCKKLTNLLNYTSQSPVIVQLPSEAQWEYALTCGKSMDGVLATKEVRDNFLNKSNEWGISRGKHYEWCKDWYGDDDKVFPDSEKIHIDPIGPSRELAKRYLNLKLQKSFDKVVKSCVGNRFSDRYLISRDGLDPHVLVEGFDTSFRMMIIVNSTVGME